MSAATSPGTGLAYGLRRVCAAWGMARSSFYAMTSGQHAEQPPANRGPKPAISDQALTIEADLEASPWEGEGWRHPGCPQAGAPPDARTICSRPIAAAAVAAIPMTRSSCPEPHVGHRWRSGVHGGRRLGLDLHRRRALERRVCRLACLQARRPLRRPAADLHGACRAVWLDRGRRGSGAGLADGSRSQYLSDHFTNQIKFWGIQPSYAFVAEPQTNGVAERFNRTLKEQIIHGRIYRNIAELRDAVRDFVELYNAQWIVEKNGYLSPAQARQAWHAAISIRPAA